MAEENAGATSVGSSRPIDLAGDSPELIAFALLRYLAQIEQHDDSITFDRAWMLDAYAECLSAVQGKRQTAKSKTANPSHTGRTRAKMRQG